MLRPIFSIDINTHGDRKLSNYVNSVLKNYILKMFKFLFIFFTGIIIPG